MHLNIHGRNCTQKYYYFKGLGYTCQGRLGKLAFPRVNDDQKIDVDYQKSNSGRPHDAWIFGRLCYKILPIIPRPSTVLQYKYT